MAGLKRFLRELSLYRLDLDRWTVVYLVVSGFYPLLKPSVTPAPLLSFVLHLLLAMGVWFLPPWARRSRSKALRLAGEIYLPFIFPFFYGEMEYLGLIFYDFAASLDPYFIHVEEMIFGFQPSLVWSEAWPWSWLHELFELAYFSYYFIALTALIMILRGKSIPDHERWPALRAFTRDLGATMLICYTLYIFLPVWGPKYFHAGPVELSRGIFTRIMEYIHANGAILGAAFPSSHVAATMIPWWHVWKWFPQHRWWMTILFATLCASTVYCRYHYVVDVIGGLFLGGLVLWLGARFGETYLRRSPPMPSVDHHG